MSNAIVAYAEKESWDPQTGEQGVLRDEWRIRSVTDFTREELEAAWGPDWRIYKPYASHVLEHRYIRRGVEEPWEPRDSANSFQQALEGVDNRATPVAKGLVNIQEKRNTYRDQTNAKEKADAEKQAAASERAHHKRRSQAAFEKLLAGKAAVWARSWNEWMKSHQDRRDEFKDDPEFMRLYTEANDSESSVSKRVAIKAFLKYAEHFGGFSGVIMETGYLESGARVGVPDRELTRPGWRGSYKLVPLRGWGSTFAVFDEAVERFIGWCSISTVNEGMNTNYRDARSWIKATGYFEPKWLSDLFVVR